jgi:hypothetical protein
MWNRLSGPRAPPLVHRERMSTSLARAPPATVATRACGSTATSRIPVRSTTSPPSRRARPAQSCPPPHRQRQPVAPRGTHRHLHVLGLFAERDYRRAATHGAVPHTAALLIEFVPRQRPGPDIALRSSSAQLEITRFVGSSIVAFLSAAANDGRSSVSVCSEPVRCRSRGRLSFRRTAPSATGHGRAIVGALAKKMSSSCYERFQRGPNGLQL